MPENRTRSVFVFALFVTLQSEDISSIPFAPRAFAGMEQVARMFSAVSAGALTCAPEMQMMFDAVISGAAGDATLNDRISANSRFLSMAALNTPYR